MAKYLSFLISSFWHLKIQEFFVTWKRASEKDTGSIDPEHRANLGADRLWHIARGGNRTALAKPLWNHWPCAFSLPGLHSATDACGGNSQQSGVVAVRFVQRRLKRADESRRPWQGHLRRFKMQRRTPRGRCWRLLEAQVFDSATIVLVFCSCYALLAGSCSCGWQTQICLKHTQLVLKLKPTKPSGVYWNRVSDDENPVCLGYFWVHF